MRCQLGYARLDIGVYSAQRAKNRCVDYIRRSWGLWKLLCRGARVLLLVVAPQGIKMSISSPQENNPAHHTRPTCGVILCSRDVW